MEFCPECGAMLLPKDGILKCSCGYEKGSSDAQEYKVSENITETESVKMLGEDVDVGPITNETCPECGHDKATYKLLQTRSADEAPTRIFTCAKCKHTWRAYDWGFLMKDSKEKEHRISNLQDMINTVKDEDQNLDFENMEEDSELIDYLNQDTDYDELEIDDEFIYHPGDDKSNAINLEENPIDEDFIIKAPKSSEPETSEEYGDDIAGEISESFDNIVNAKIGRTPVMGMISSILGLVLIVIAAMIFSSRSDKIVDNVISGENSFMSVIFAIIGLLLLIYGLYKVLGFKNPLSNLSNSIDSIEKDKDDDDDQNSEIDENAIPKSNIPLDKESYKIGEFNFRDLKKNLKKPMTVSERKPTPFKKSIDNQPEVDGKPAKKRALTDEELEHDQVILDNESIDDIFAEVEDIEDIPVISIDSQEEK